VKNLAFDTSKVITNAWFSMKNYIRTNHNLQGSKNWGFRPVKINFRPLYFIRLQPVGPVQNKMCVCVFK